MLEKKYTAISMRDEMILLAEAVKKIEVSSSKDEVKKNLQEKFLKATDPSIAMGLYMDEASKILSSMVKLYDNAAEDRNKIVDPILDFVGEMDALGKQLRSSLSKSKNNPEDTNSSI